MKIPQIGPLFVKIGLFLERLFKNKKILIGIVAVLSLSIAFYLFVSNRYKAERATVIMAKVYPEEGALDAGNRVVVSVVASSTSMYTSAEIAASFVGNLYDITWKSGLKTMARAPLKVWIPIPPNYYLGDTSSNLSAVEIIGGMPYTLYGGQIRIKNGYHYLEVLTYFPGIVGITLKQSNSSYGFKLIKKVSDNSPNLVIVPGSNINFSGNIPGVARNLWVQNFPNYNVYVFSYPLTSTKSLSYTAKIIDYFQKVGVSSYTQYMGENLANILSTLRGQTYIIAQGIGGLIVRYALQTNPTLKGVKKVVLFDTPSLGTDFASPYVLSNLYNAGTDFVSREFSVSPKAVNYAINISTAYLRLINFFAKDISPNSGFLSRLNSTPQPTDTVFLSIAGTKPNISLQKSPKMESLFPQLIDGEGDGVVSEKSALYFGNVKLKFPYSFYSIFAHQDVQNTLKKFISGGGINSKTVFKSDSFVETQNSMSASKTTVSSPGIVSRSYKYLSAGDYLIKPASEGTYFSQCYSIRVPKAKKILEGLEGIYLVSNKSAYFLSFGGYQLIYRGQIRFSNTYEGHMYIVTKNMQVLDFVGSTSKLRYKLPFNNYRSIFVTNKAIYALKSEATSTLFENVTERKVLLKIPGKYSAMRYIPSDHSFVIVSDSYIAVYNIENHAGSFFEKMKEIMEKAGFNSDQYIPIDSVYIKDNVIYLLSSNYILLAIDMKTHGVQIIGNGNVGNLKLIFYNNLLVVVGRRTLNIYDTLSRVKIPIYQVINNTIDAITFNGSIFLLQYKGGKYELKRYQRVQ